MLNNQKPDRGMKRGRLAPPVVSRSRRERACDTICDMHECVISGCAGAIMSATLWTGCYRLNLDTATGDDPPINIDQRPCIWSLRVRRAVFD